MPFDSQVALLGTGVAPLIAASHLMFQGKSVLVLNPDLDFFLEDSEFPLDPLLTGPFTAERISRSLPEQALSVLRPDFPGAIEHWSGGRPPKAGYHDPAAPHLRERDRLWVADHSQGSWDALETLFVEASDSGLNPQIVEGPALAKFPGMSGTPSSEKDYRGLLIPRLCDIDMMRYRIGLLEFIREKLGSDRLITAVSQVDMMPGGVRFRVGRKISTARLESGLLVFWTPRLTNWVSQQFRNHELKPRLPKGVRLWEQWSLVSQQPHSGPLGTTVGSFAEMVAWNGFEGPPNGSQTHAHLKVARSGPLIAMSELSEDSSQRIASGSSIQNLSALCQGFLNRENATIREYKTQAVFEWEESESSIWQLGRLDPPIHIVQNCDGPLVDVVRVVKQSCDAGVS